METDNLEVNEKEENPESVTVTSEKALVKQVSHTPSDLLFLAVQKDLDIAKLEKLMELQERWEKNEAKKAFVTAMAAFKKDPPPIIKDMHVEYKAGGATIKYNHASLGNIVASVTEALSKHQMSVNWQTEQNEKAIKVTCIITHIAGHNESTSITAPPDNSGSKNPIQAIGSTITYLQRYTLLSICGLATNEFENDGMIEKPPKTKQSKSPHATTTLDGKISVALTLLRELNLSNDDRKQWLDSIENAKQETIDSILVDLKTNIASHLLDKLNFSDDKKKTWHDNIEKASADTIDAMLTTLQNVAKTKRNLSDKSAISQQLPEIDFSSLQQEWIELKKQDFKLPWERLNKFIVDYYPMLKFTHLLNHVKKHPEDYEDKKALGYLEDKHCDHIVNLICKGYFEKKE